MASRGGVIGNRNVGPKAPLSRKPAPPPSIAKNVPGVKSAAAVAHAALRSPGVTYKTAAGATTAAAGVAPVAHPNAGSSTAFNAANVSALFGLPPVADELRVVLEGNPKPEFGRDYNDILAATDNIGRPRNALPGSDRKAHEQHIKDIIASLKAALRDALSRKATALERCREIEAGIAAKFFEASKLSTNLRDAQATIASKDDENAKLRRELENAIAQITTAKANEQGADADLEEALASVEKANARAAELEARIVELETELAEQRVVEEGLRADVDERDERLAAIARDARQSQETLASELERVKRAGDAATAAANARVATLEAAVSAGTSELRMAEARVKELERAASVGEADAFKLRSEREAVAQQKATLAEEVERVREQSRQMEASYICQIASLTRTGEVTSRQCVDLSRQIDAKSARAEELLLERDALRSSEADLRRELKDVTRLEAETSAKLAAMTTTAENTARELDAARREALNLKAELLDVTSKLESTISEAAAAREELLSDLALAGGKLVDAETKLATATAAEAAWAVRAAEWESAKTDLTTGKAAAEETVADLTSQLTALRESAGASEESQLERLTQMSREAETLRRRMKEMRDITGRLAAAEAEAAKLREEAFGNEMARRALHNMVQELKGNIRVCIRVRPYLGVDAAEADGAEGTDSGTGPAIAVAPDGTSLTIAPPPPRGTKAGPLHNAGGALSAPAKPLPFSFDTVFGPRASQADVFAEVSHLVQSALDGYNVCLFSYGQTGSGKTWTMQGGANPDDRGLIPRSVEQILDTAGRLADSGGWTYRLEASFLEIYNETIRDLLRAPAGSAAAIASGRGGASAAPAALSLHQLDGTDPAGGIEVPGLTHVPITSADDVTAVLARAARRRAVAATDMNEVSSRSHCVFTLSIRGSHARRGIAVTGALNLVDLAGSERLDRSGAEGDRKRETAAINKSLSCLADVFAALSAHKPHIPFRNSKLTHLLAPCFSRDGKTLMLVNLSPSAESASESLCSLRFASQVGQVELGKPRRRVVEALPSQPTVAEAPVVFARPPSRAAAAAADDDDARSIMSHATAATGSGMMHASLTGSPPAPDAHVSDSGDDDDYDTAGDGAPAALRERKVAITAPSPAPVKHGVAAPRGSRPAPTPSAAAESRRAVGTVASAARHNVGPHHVAGRTTASTAVPSSAVGGKRPATTQARAGMSASAGMSRTTSAPVSEIKRPRFGMK